MGIKEGRELRRRNFLNSPLSSSDQEHFSIVLRDEEGQWDGLDARRTIVDFYDGNTKKNHSLTDQSHKGPNLRNIFGVKHNYNSKAIIIMANRYML